MNQPPHNTEAEKSLLGSLLIDPELVPRISKLLHPEHFYGTAGHMFIYQTILDLWEAGAAIDFLTVCDGLHGKLNSVGTKDLRGEAYISILVADVPTSLNAEHYAQIILNCANKRALDQAARLIAKAAYDDNLSDTDAYLSALETLKNAEPTGKPVAAIKSDMGTTLTAVGEAHAQQLADEGYEVKWPWPRMRAYVRRWRVGQPAILIAEGGAGKTAFCMAVARENATNGGNIFYVHTEDTPSVLLLRQLSSISGIPFSNIEEHAYDPKKQHHTLITINGVDIEIPYNLLNSAQSMKAWRGNLWFIHAEGKTMPEVVYDLERAERDLGMPDAVIFDWFLDHRMRTGSENTTIKLMMDIKDLKDYTARCPTRLLIAMQTGKKGGDKRRLTAYDAFWTSAAAHYGKIVFTLRRERELVDGEAVGEFKPTMEVFVSKANLDQTGMFKLAMNGPTFAIYEPELETTKLGYAF